MRAFFTSVMSVLVIAALFWGNCLSCPQVLQALVNHQPMHGCCHHSKKTPDGCTTQALHQYVKADPGASAQAPAVVAAPLAVLVVPAPGWVSPSTPVLHTPPDLLLLHRNIRI